MNERRVNRFAWGIGLLLAAVWLALFILGHGWALLVAAVLAGAVLLYAGWADHRAG